MGNDGTEGIRAVKARWWCSTRNKMKQVASCGECPDGYRVWSGRPCISHWAKWAERIMTYLFEDTLLVTDGLMKISPEEFQQVRDLIQRLCGISLSRAKRVSHYIAPRPVLHQC